MAYIKQTGLAADAPYANVPLIGYDNVVTESNISSTTAAAGFPITNVANPSTFLKWKASVNTGDEFITLTTGLLTTTSYLAIAKHNLGSQAVLVALEANDPSHILLHLNRSGNSPDVVIDSNTVGIARTWTAVTPGFLDTTEKKFGDASFKPRGGNSPDVGYISTSTVSDMIIGSRDFTIDFWVKANNLTSNPIVVFSQATNGADFYYIQLSSNGQIAYVLLVSSVNVFSASSALSVFTTGVWHHIAVVRSGNAFTIYMDGTVVASGTNSAVYPPLTLAYYVGGLPPSVLDGWIDEFRMVIGVARWTSAFTPPVAPAGWTTLVNGSPDDSQALLHFNGTDGSTSIVDSNSIGSDHPWTANGNAQLDELAKFGETSLLTDGTGDYVSTPVHSDFLVGSQDFTVDFWFNFNAAGGSQAFAASLFDGGVPGSSWVIYKESSANVIIATSYQGASTQYILASTTAFTNALNTGWHHIAYVRTGNTLKLFIDGVQEGGNLSITGAINDPSTSAALTVGGIVGGGSGWIGWIDEFRYTVGTARWTSNFTPPTSPAESGSSIADDSPILFRWAPQAIGGLRLHLRADLAVPEIAVIYAGQLLVMERSITVGQKHVPITYGRRTNVVNGMSETGNFIGRIVLGEYRESKAEFEWFTPTFYRSSIDAFLDAAQERPFFWVWSPDEYPNEVGYVWLTNDAEPDTDPATRRVALTLNMRGIA